MEFFTYRLPNGIRGIHRQVKSNVAHCALVVNAGSRDEHPDQYGLAHFTEHAFFKGTRRRRAWQVNCRLENLGGAEFSEIWRRALGLLDLPDPARAAMENLGGSLGRYGAAEQAAAISACEQELRREAERAAQEAQVMGRLRAGLAAGAGLILAIVLY